MRNWTGASLRTRTYAALAVGLTLLQGGVVIFGEPGQAMRLAPWFGGVVLAMTLATAALVLYRIRRWLGPLEWIGYAMVVAGGVRVLALLPLTYGLSAHSDGLLRGAQVAMLVGCYAAMVLGFTGISVVVGRQDDSRRALTLALVGSLGVSMMFFIAAFGPLPSMPTVLTHRDYQAMGLLAADLMLLTMSAFTMLTWLSLPGGAMARPWLWISVGFLGLAMGDTIQPLLTVVDSAMFAALLWGLGYALLGTGVSMMGDLFAVQGDEIAYAMGTMKDRRAA